jgi:hypothetical protein
MRTLWKIPSHPARAKSKGFGVDGRKHGTTDVFPAKVMISTF